MQMWCQDNMSVLYVPHQKKKFANIDGVRIVGGENVLNRRILVN
jgi:hypothetical protein